MSKIESVGSTKAITITKAELYKLEFHPSFHNFLLLVRNPTFVALVLSVCIGSAVWQLPTSDLLDRRGVGFIATLSAGIVLWLSEALDDYVVALLIFLSWIVLGVAPPNIALSGFATESWFFLVAALGITATVSRSGLFKRMALRLLLRVPPTYQKTYGILLLMSGILLTPLIPTAKGRVTLMTPMVNAITRAVGFKPRSTHSAALNLTAYLGVGQMSFLFLTGDTAILGAWSLLPQMARSEFGWMTWALAAFPLGVVISIISLVTLHLMFYLKAEDAGSPVVSLTSIQKNLTDMGSLKRDEWLSIGILAVALGGWVSNSSHGIGETWIATGAFLIALVSGALNKEKLQKNIDWSFVLFFGVICSMGVIADKLKIDIWLGTLTEPFLSLLVHSPSVFLMATVLIATVVRVFLRKTASYIFLTLALISWAPIVGVHPGILLLTIVFAAEGWFFQYQDGGYQLFYCTTGGEAFSHRQARRLMIVKFAATFIALLISVPYWRYLGLVK